MDDSASSLMGRIFPEFFINYLRKIMVATFSIVGDCLQFNIYIINTAGPWAGAVSEMFGSHDLKIMPTLGYMG